MQGLGQGQQECRLSKRPGQGKAATVRVQDRSEASGIRPECTVLTTEGSDASLHQAFMNHLLRAGHFRTLGIQQWMGRWEAAFLP